MCLEQGQGGKEEEARMLLVKVMGWHWNGLTARQSYHGIRLDSDDLPI